MNDKHLMSLHDIQNIIAALSSILFKIEDENSKIEDYIKVIDDINHIKEINKLNRFLLDIVKSEQRLTEEEEDLIYPYISIVHLNRYCSMLNAPNIKQEKINTYKDMICLTLQKYRIDLRGYMLIHYGKWE